MSKASPWTLWLRAFLHRFTGLDDDGARGIGLGKRRSDESPNGRSAIGGHGRESLQARGRLAGGSALIGHRKKHGPDLHCHDRPKAAERVFQLREIRGNDDVDPRDSVSLDLVGLRLVNDLEGVETECPGYPPDEPASFVWLHYPPVTAGVLEASEGDSLRLDHAYASEIGSSARRISREDGGIVPWVARGDRIRDLNTESRAPLPPCSAQRGPIAMGFSVPTSCFMKPALVACAAALTVACATGPTAAELERRRREFPFKVVGVPSPCELVVELPHGAELIHLQYVSRAAKGPLAESAITRLRELTRDGVDVRFDLAYPLFADTRGVPVARVAVPSLDWHPTAGRRRTLNEDLLIQGVGLNNLQASSPETEILDSDYFVADFQARSLRLGVYAAPLATQEAVVTSNMAVTALAEARALLEAEGARLEGDRTIVLVDKADMERRLAEHGDPAPSTTVLALTPPGPSIFVRDRLPLAPDDAERFLRILLVHELVHAWQLGKGLQMRGSYISAALAEGHAQFWSHRVATRRGLVEDWNGLSMAGRHYATGFAFWRSVYAWLEANGVSLTLADEAAVLARLHDLLLGPQAPDEEDVLDDPMLWLGANVSGFPAAPWTIEVDRETRHPGGDVDLRWKLINPSRWTLSFCLHHDGAAEALELRDGQWRGIPSMEDTGGFPVVVVVPPNSSRPLPYAIRVRANDTLPARCQLSLRTRLVAAGDGGPLFFNGVTSAPHVVQKR